MEGEWDETLELQKWELLDLRAKTPAFAGTILFVLHSPFTHWAFAQNFQFRYLRKQPCANTSILYTCKMMV